MLITSARTWPILNLFTTPAPGSVGRPAARATVWLPALAVTAFAAIYLPLASLLVQASTPSDAVSAASNLSHGATSLTTASPAGQPAIPACTPSAATQPSALSLDSQPAGLSVQTDPYALYQIYGNTADGLREQIQHCAPGASNSNLAEFTGETSYNLSWQYSMLVSGRSCQIVNAKVGVHIVTSLPDWQAPSTATAGLDGRWQAFITSLKTHEQGHATLDKLYAAKLTSDLSAIGTVDCDQLSGTAKAIVQADVDTLNQANAQYDAQTDHGTTQGAILPSN